jgi:peptidoglycan/LPS O-acetylase OafA/YrhL
VAAYLFSLSGNWWGISALATAILLPKLLVDNTWLSKAFGAQVLQWIGKRTYSMYLLHAFCLSAIEDHVIRPTTTVRYFAVFVLTFLLCLAAGSLTYSFVELPLIRLGRRLARRKATKASAIAVHRSGSSLLPSASGPLAD